MEIVYLIKYGELALKGGNRRLFERRVCEDIREKLSGIELKLQRERGRLYLYPPEEAGGEQPAGGAPARKIEAGLARTFGIVSFARSYVVDQDIGEIEKAACTLAEELRGSRGNRFKVEARRSDKSFPYGSYDIACILGDRLRGSFPALVVDLHHPDWIVQVEVRRRVYVYGPQLRAPGGLPLGSSGKGLLLLSGGIDSPVAGYLMGKRGLRIDGIYFHTPPYTSEQAREKVQRLAGILSGYATGMRLFVAPFTDVQLRINEGAARKERTLLVRAAMMHIAEQLARRSGASCLITGESLGQVASQTVESLHFTGSRTSLPVFRPLIGLDKEEIIRLSRQIGTYETSILPYADCCTLFAPEHPLVRPRLARMARSFESLEIAGLLEKAAREAACLEVA
jgi:thiamine biosynthesis protein ThiI